MSDATPVFDENSLYMPAEDPDIFYAEIDPNSTSQRCNLDGVYELHVNTANLSLVDATTRKPAFTWPFRYIRRYGRNKTTFQFEAGRRCPSGEGLFAMKTEEGVGEKIFKCIEARLATMKARDQQYQNENVAPPPRAAAVAAAAAPAGAAASAAPGKPAVPARQYSQSSYQNMAAAPAAPPAAAAGEKKSKQRPTVKPPGGDTSAKVAAPPVKVTAPPAKPTVKPSALPPPPPVSDEATYSEIYAAGGSAYSLVQDPPAVYAAVVKKPAPAAAAASSRLGGGAAAAAPTSAINRLIAEQRETIRRLDAEQSEGYGTVGSSWASGGADGASGGAAAEYGTVDPRPAGDQQYYLVSPTDDSPVDEVYAEAHSGARPAARK